MLQTVLERTPTIDQINDPWAPQQKEIHASIAKSILIVEDDAGIRESLGEILQEETIHQIFLAQDGESLSRCFKLPSPKYLLLDYRLPDINGLELLDHIRRIKGHEQTPVVLMSASLFPGEYHQGLP